MDNILFIDIETIGLPQFNYGNFYHYKNVKKYNNARIVEIAWVLTSKNGEIISKNRYIIKPDNYIINNSNIHGITQDEAISKGIKICEVFTYLTKDLKKTKYIVAHNIEFDYNILCSEMFRYKQLDILQLMIDKEKICTCNSAINITKLNPKRYGKYKKPTLTELYYFCFKDNFNSHKALNDVEAMLKCFFFLIDNGKFKL